MNPRGKCYSHFPRLRGASRPEARDVQFHAVPPEPVLAEVVAGAVGFAIWLAVVVAPQRPWDLYPRSELQPSPRHPSSWPAVTVIVPARNESKVLPSTLPALLAQEYGGHMGVILVDDRSSDDTASIAHHLARDAGAGGRVRIVSGSSLAAGWTGKVWALAQGVEEADPTSTYLLLSDADIHHGSTSIQRLVSESEADNLALNSRMARLRCHSRAESFLIPPFLFFFNLLYPMRLVNDPKSRIAAAAGGCVLVRRDALDAIGGFESIQGEIIDDVNLAKKVKSTGRPIRLSLCEADVTSVRAYGSVSAVWRMVRRTAFDELNYSWALLGVTLIGLALLFVTPPALFFAGAALSGAQAAGATNLAWQWIAALGGLGLVSWTVMAGVFRPTTNYFGLPWYWTWTLPAAGVVYGAITFDSAFQHARNRGQEW